MRSFTVFKPRPPQGVSPLAPPGFVRYSQRRAPVPLEGSRLLPDSDTPERQPRLSVDLLHLKVLKRAWKHLNVFVKTPEFHYKEPWGRYFLQIAKVVVERPMPVPLSKELVKGYHREKKLQALKRNAAKSFAKWDEWDRQRALKKAKEAQFQAKVPSHATVPDQAPSSEIATKVQVREQPKQVDTEVRKANSLKVDTEVRKANSPVDDRGQPKVDTEVRKANSPVVDTEVRKANSPVDDPTRPKNLLEMSEDEACSAGASGHPNITGRSKVRQNVLKKANSSRKLFFSGSQKSRSTEPLVGAKSSSHGGKVCESPTGGDHPGSAKPSGNASIESGRQPVCQQEREKKGVNTNQEEKKGVKTVRGWQHPRRALLQISPAATEQEHGEKKGDRIFDMDDNLDMDDDFDTDWIFYMDDDFDMDLGLDRILDMHVELEMDLDLDLE
ncbi:hypothetical protein HDU86_005961 [Geranomyces michiganensis]|nr:hypothetical protein HDU86_005961 [Geranomyces michiganensis]